MNKDLSSNIKVICIFNSRWITGAAVVNAFYSSSRNQIGTCNIFTKSSCNLTKQIRYVWSII